MTHSVWGHGGYGMGGLALGAALTTPLALEGMGVVGAMADLLQIPVATSILTPAQAAYYLVLSDRAQALDCGDVSGVGVAYILSGLFSVASVALSIAAFATPWWRVEEIPLEKANLVLLISYLNCWDNWYSTIGADGPDWGWCETFARPQSLQNVVDSLYGAGVSFYVLGVAACVITLAALCKRGPRREAHAPLVESPPPPAHLPSLGLPKAAAAVLLTAGLVAVYLTSRSLSTEWQCSSPSCVVPTSGFHCAIAAVVCVATAGVMNLTWGGLLNAEFAKKLAAAGPPPPPPPAPTPAEAVAFALAPSLSLSGSLIPAADATAVAEARAGIVPPPAVLPVGAPPPLVVGLEPVAPALKGDALYTAALAYFSGVPPGMTGVPLVLVMNGGVYLRKVVVVTASSQVGAPPPLAVPGQTSVDVNPDAADPVSYVGGSPTVQQPAAAADPQEVASQSTRVVVQTPLVGYGAPPAYAPGWGAGGGGEWGKVSAV